MPPRFRTAAAIVKKPEGPAIAGTLCLDVHRLTMERPSAVFILTPKAPVSQEDFDIILGLWQAMWRDHGHDGAPGLMLLPHGTTLTPEDSTGAVAEDIGYAEIAEPGQPVHVPDTLQPLADIQSVAEQARMRLSRGHKAHDVLRDLLEAFEPRKPGQRPN